MFPGPHAEIYRNEAGEPLGWDNHYYDEEPYDLDEYLDYGEDDDDDGEEDEDEDACPPQEETPRSRDLPGLW